MTTKPITAILAYQIGDEHYLMHYLPSDPTGAGAALARWAFNKELEFNYRDAFTLARPVRLRAKQCGAGF